MSLSKKLGPAFEKTKDSIQIKTITVDLGDVKFDLQLRVPKKKEMEALNGRILSPSKERVDAAYEKIAGPMLKTLTEGGAEFLDALNKNKKTVIVSDDDLVVDGTSLRQVANFSAIEDARVEEYFHLLISQTGEPITETVEEIGEEFPEFAIKEIIQTIQNAISPDYKNAKKN